MTPPREPRTEKRCRVCRQAHWRAPAGWIADHTSEPVDMPITAEAEQAYRAALAASPAPTDEERAAFKRSEYEAMRRIIATPAPAPLDVPDMSVLTAVLDDVPLPIIETAKGDGEGLAAYIVGKWPEYARLTARVAATEDTNAQ